MSLPADDAADLDLAAVRRRAALWVLVVQCLLALSWTLYVLFLPGLLAKAGIEKRWLIYVLIADQLIFAACDWAAGVYADRIAVVWKRLGRIITATTMLSSAALLAMPWIAESGSAPLLLGTIFLWAGTSSALRAPVFALLGRVRESSGATTRGGAGMVSMALVGISLAAAVGPYLTMLLKGIDDHLPLALSAVSLALAGLWATRVESILPQLAASDAPETPAATTVRQRALTLAAIVLIAAFGTQVVTGFIAVPLYQRFVGSDAVLWAAWFWVGFAVGLAPGARIAARARPLVGAAIALVIALVAVVVAERADAIALLVAGTAIAGGCWGVFSAAAFTSAVSISSGRATTRGAGTASGMLFSALALATVARLALTLAGQSKASFVPWLPGIAWALASVLLIAASATLWRNRETA